MKSESLPSIFVTEVLVIGDVVETTVGDMVSGGLSWASRALNGSSLCGNEPDNRDPFLED